MIRMWLRSAPASFFTLILCSFGRLDGQLPAHPQNLQVLPKTLSTDSVFSLMLGVADALGTTCGHCHVGGDRPDWDSTHFSDDAIRAKRVAREMFRLTDRLNRELLPAALVGGAPTVSVTCVTCHRGALRPITIQDTLTTILERQGVDSALALRERVRRRFAGLMTYDLTETPVLEIARRLQATNRLADGTRLLEALAREFPESATTAYELGAAYEAAGKVPLAITQFHRALSLDPTLSHADQRLRALMSRQPRSTP